MQYSCHGPAVCDSCTVSLRNPEVVRLLCVHWSQVQNRQLSSLPAMISHPVIWAFRSSVRCWRHRTVLKVALGSSDVSFWRRYSTPVRGSVTSMEEILARVVAPLPTYETRDKSPPPPESNSLDFMHFYNSLNKEDKLAVLTRLSQDFGVDHKSVSELAAKLLDTQLRDLATILQVEDRLRYSLTPRYKQLLNHISRVQGGVKFLVDLRADVLEIISTKASESPHIRVKNACLHFLRVLAWLKQCRSRLGGCHCWLSS